MYLYIVSYYNILFYKVILCIQCEFGIQKIIFNLIIFNYSLCVCSGYMVRNDKKNWLHNSRV